MNVSQITRIDPYEKKETYLAILRDSRNKILVSKTGYLKLKEVTEVIGLVLLKHRIFSFFPSSVSSCPFLPCGNNSISTPSHFQRTNDLMPVDRFYRSSEINRTALQCRRYMLQTKHRSNSFFICFFHSQYKQPATPFSTSASANVAYTGCTSSLSNAAQSSFRTHAGKF